MARMDKVGTHKTTVRVTGPVTTVRYHQTDVVAFDADRIILCTGGWKTPTTKLRMNQASREYSLGYGVYQKKGSWCVAYRGNEIPFVGRELILHRNK